MTLQPFQPRVPNQLERDFQLLFPLSEGPTGTVWKAEERATGREVTIKILGGDVVVDAPGLVASAQKLVALDHKAMSRNLAVVSSGSPWFIVREFVEGRPLGEVLAGQPLEITSFFRLAKQITSAVAQAHDRGLVHGNLRSDNVILDRPNMLLHVAGWGLVKRGYAQQSLGKPENLSYLTTREVAAIAPEQILGSSPDAKSDVFSLGVLFYQMLSGRAPFRGSTSLEILTSILNTEAPDLREWTKDVPAELLGLVNRCLQKDPAGRPMSAVYLLNELKKATGFTDDETAKIRIVPPPPKARAATLLLVSVPSNATSGGDTLHQRKIVEKMLWTPVLEHEGRLVNALSSTFIAEFADARKALKAAKAARHQIDRYNASRSGAPVRAAIVMHSGDVIEKDSAIVGPTLQLAVGALRCVPTIEIHLSEPAAIAAGLRFKGRPWTIFNGDRFYAMDVAEPMHTTWQFFKEWKLKKIATVVASVALTSAAALVLTVTRASDPAPVAAVHHAQTAATRVPRVMVVPFETSRGLRVSPEVQAIRTAVVTILETTSTVKVASSTDPFDSEIGARVLEGSASTELVPFVRNSSVAREAFPLTMTDPGEVVVKFVGWTMTELQASAPPTLNVESVNAYLKAISLAASGDNKGALAAIDASLKVDPGFAAALSARARLLESMSQGRSVELSRDIRPTR